MTHDERMRPRTVAPGDWLGLLGGGQLGRMFAMAAQSLGYRVAVLDPARDGPAASVCDEHIEAGYLDAPALENLALQCSAVTTEFENVPAQSLAFLSEHCFTTPSAESVAVAQDRIAEKGFIASCGIAVVPHAVIESAADLDQVADHLFPGILKASRLGYDGKGQVRIASRAEARDAFASLGATSAVFEKRVDLAYEISVVVARGADGATAIYAPAENLHRDGILAVTLVPSPSTTPAVEADAIAAALRIAHALDYVGVLCVEFFVTGDKTADEAMANGHVLLVNEIAPRPHNSGHYTIDACITSQFAQQARIAAGLPLGDTRRHGAAVMLNLLGDLWFVDRLSDAEVVLQPRAEAADDVDAKATADVDRLLANAEAAIAVDDAAVPSPAARRAHDPADVAEPDWRAVLAHPGVNLHLYGKREARRGRKMGHVTIVAERPAEARRIALEVARVLGIAGW